MKGKTVQLPLNALASNILCERHNSALSPLDSTAESFYIAARDDQQSLAESSHPQRALNAFSLVQGSVIELWLLKVIWGAAWSGSLGRDGAATRELKESADRMMLADILWRGAEWPEYWGLYAQRHAVDPRGRVGSIGIQALSGPADDVWGATLEIGALQLTLALGVLEGPEGTVFYRPGSFNFSSVQVPGVEKLLALCWPETGHAPISYARLGDLEE